MATFILTMVYLCVFSFVMGLFPVEWENRPRLQALGYEITSSRKKKRSNPFSFLRKIAIINKPLCSGLLRARLIKDLTMAHVPLNPEEFFMIKEILIGVLLYFSYSFVQPDTVFFWLTMCFAFGYLIPEYWLKGRIRKVKDTMVKELPDAIDLLGLCVNAGLDFMLALKWVVEKSPPSVMVVEFNTVMQEINLGKTRREALKDLASRYDLTDLHSFSRTLIQADKMGTSVTEALNILSEDMRIARFRRGEQMALKAPMKMLIPLLFFIFPTVGILVCGPVFLDFIENNPMSGLAGG